MGCCLSLEEKDFINSYDTWNYYSQYYNESSFKLSSDYITIHDAMIETEQQYKNLSIKLKHKYYSEYNNYLKWKKINIRSNLMQENFNSTETETGSNDNYPLFN